MTSCNMGSIDSLIDQAEAGLSVRQYTEMPRAEFEKRNMLRQQEFQQLSIQIGHIQLAIQKDQDQASRPCSPAVIGIWVESFLWEHLRGILQHAEVRGSQSDPSQPVPEPASLPACL